MERAFLNALVTCKVGSQVFPARAIDIGHSGIFLETDFGVSVGKTLQLRLSLPDRRRTRGVFREGTLRDAPGEEDREHFLDLRGKVTRRQEADPAKSLPAGFGVQFADLGKAEKDTIEAFIASASFESALRTRLSDEPATGQTKPGLRYKLIRILGAGGMGQVYRAYDHQLREYVAIKVLAEDLSSDEKMVQRFQNEARLMRRILHPNVVRVHDFGEAGRHLYFTMQYVEGLSLSDLLQEKGVLTIGDLVPIARQVTAGLHAIHSLGVVHRDLKPGNILIDRQGVARLADFGIAKSLERGTNLTEKGFLLGTAEYVSPEQVRGEPVSEKSDLYSFGSVLYEMATGAPPFNARTTLATVYQVAHHLPEPPSRRRPGIPRELEDLIHALLEKDPARRPATALEAMLILDRLTPHYRESPPPPPPAPKALLAEEDQTVRAILSLILEDTGYDVTEVGDGYAAMELAFRQRFDLTVLGSRMKRIGGIEACQILKGNEKTRGSRILLTTRNPREEGVVSSLGVKCIVWQDPPPESLYVHVREIIQRG